MVLTALTYILLANGIKLLFPKIPLSIIIKIVDDIIIAWISIEKLLSPFIKKWFYLLTYFLDRGREGERGGEKHQCMVASCAPYRGPGLQPRHVPWLRIELVTFCSQSTEHTNQGEKPFSLTQHCHYHISSNSKMLVIMTCFYFTLHEKLQLCNKTMLSSYLEYYFIFKKALILSSFFCIYIKSKLWKENNLFKLLLLNHQIIHFWTTFRIENC